MTTITVTTQIELDSALEKYAEDRSATINIDSPRGVWLSLSENGAATVWVSGSSTVEVSGTATVWAFDSSTVDARDSARVTAFDSSQVSSSGSAMVLTYGSATVQPRLGHGGDRL